MIRSWLVNIFVDTEDRSTLRGAVSGIDGRRLPFRDEHQLIEILKGLVVPDPPVPFEEEPQERER